jgi:hypothetical protein
LVVVVLNVLSLTLLLPYAKVKIGIGTRGRKKPSFVPPTTELWGFHRALKKGSRGRGGNGVVVGPFITIVRRPHPFQSASNE